MELNGVAASSTGAECAFCGCAMFKSQRVRCDDCQVDHLVCQTCADEVASASDLEGLRLVA